MIMKQSKYKQHQQRTSTPKLYLPMLCSSSAAKEVKLPSSRCRSSSSEEPSSPRVGCMGQVKRTNKVVAFPSTLFFKQSDHQSCSNLHNNNSNVVKYQKLKRFFSAKNLTSSPATNAGTHKVKRTTSARNSKMVLCRSQDMGNEKSTSEMGSFVNLEELDPPLPVIKRPTWEEEEEEGSSKRHENMSLWKRRSGGAPLKTLQVQVIHPKTNHTILPANTV